MSNSKVLKPANVIAGSDNTFEHDRLQRADFVQYLAQLSMASAGHWCVALNGEWGSGKTTVLRLLEDAIKSDGGKCVLIDIWQEDYADDPILPLVSAILRACDEGTDAAAAVKNAAGRIAMGGLNLAMKHLRINKIAGTVAHEASAHQQASASWNQYRETQEARQSLKDGLVELARQRKDQKPVVIIVDELDRCRPLHAVALLERIKHFLDIESISFVLGVNLEQLAHTIEGCYGEKFDGPAYLERFFDRVIELPSEDVSLLVAEELARNFSALEIPDVPQEIQPAAALATACTLLKLTARKSLAATTDFKATWDPSQDTFNYLAPAVAQAIALSHADQARFKSVLKMIKTGSRPNVPYKADKEHHIGFHLYVTLSLMADDGNRLLSEDALHPQDTHIGKIQEMSFLLNRHLKVSGLVMRNGTANEHVQKARAFLLETLQYRT